MPWSPVLPWLLAFAAITILTTILAKEPRNSFFGPSLNNFDSAAVLLGLCFLTLLLINAISNLYRVSLIYFVTNSSILIVFLLNLYQLAKNYYQLPIPGLSIPLNSSDLTWLAVASLPLFVGQSFSLLKLKNIPVALVRLMGAVGIVACLAILTQANNLTIFLAGLIGLALPWFIWYRLLITNFSSSDFLLVNLCLSGLVLLAIFVTASHNWNLSQVTFSKNQLPFDQGLVITQNVAGKSPLLGQGPATFAITFSQFKTPAINNSQFWDKIIDRSSNWPLHLIATMGVGALLAFYGMILSFLWLIWRFFAYQTAIDPNKFIIIPFVSSILTISIITLVTVPSIYILSLLFFLIGLSIASLEALGTSLTTQKVIISERLVPQNRILLIAIYSATVVILAVGIYLSYLSGRQLAANIYFQSAKKLLEQNEPQKAYDAATHAVALWPYNDSSHRFFAQINLALAISKLTEDKNSQNAQISQQFFQQAINEARAAVVVSPANYQNWQALSQTYSVIATTIDDRAWQFAIDNAKQAVARNPNYPLLYNQLASLYLAQDQSNEAEQALNKSVQLKGNLPQTLYLQAQVYKKQAKKESYAQKLSEALFHVSLDSPDYGKIADELEKARQ